MLLHVFIFGVISFQVSYIITQWFFFRRKEFLYYILYLVLFLVYLYAYYEPQLKLTNFFLEKNENVQTFTRIIGLLIFASYVVFARYFTDSANNYPSLDLKMKWLEKFLITGFFLQLFFAFFFSSDHLREFFSWIFYIPGFSYALYLGFRLIKAKNELANYIIIGSLFAISGSFLQGIYDDILYFFYTKNHATSIIMELGFIIEFIFLNIGFMAKNKYLQVSQDQIKDNLYNTMVEKNEIANQLYNVRSKLSMDLHDDVSSSLGSIRIVSDLMTKKMEDVNSKELAQRINNDISELSEKLKTLVWSFNEKNDNLGRFLEYLTNYAEVFINETGIDCKIRVQDNLNNELILDGNIRKNIFLSIKEALHNTLKYAKATVVLIEVSINHENRLMVKINDNGIGMSGNIKLGNGIINMNKRMASINGTCEIRSKDGTEIVLECPTN
jgi:signal transduction histidine kinase